MSKKPELIPTNNDSFFGWNFYEKYLRLEDYAKPTPEDIMCEVQLNSLSTQEQLIPYISNDKFTEQIKQYENEWVPYLQRPDYHNDREGLLLFGLEGDNHNDSLSMPEARKRTGIPELKESDFSVPTQFYKDMTCLHELCEYFAPLGRTFIVKANTGSFFPPHKDFPLISRDCFRVVAFFGHVSGYRWETDGKKLDIIPGKTYYVDTRKTHQTHAWGQQPSYHLIMNIPKTWENVLKLMSICNR